MLFFTSFVYNVCHWPNTISFLGQKRVLCKNRLVYNVIWKRKETVSVDQLRSVGRSKYITYANTSLMVKYTGFCFPGQPRSAQMDSYMVALNHFYIYLTDMYMEQNFTTIMFSCPPKPLKLFYKYVSIYIYHLMNAVNDI